MECLKNFDAFLIWLWWELPVVYQQNSYVSVMVSKIKTQLKEEMLTDEIEECFVEFDEKCMKFADYIL